MTYEKDGISCIRSYYDHIIQLLWITYFHLSEAKEKTNQEIHN